MRKLLPLFVLLLLVVPAQQASALPAICWVVDSIGIGDNFAGCAGEASPTPTATPTPTPEPNCGDNGLPGKCPNGWVCQPQGITINEGYACEDPFPTPGPGCQGVTCPAGQICDPTSGGCVRDTCLDCAPGQRCVAGICTNDACAGVSCSTCQTCQNGVCVPLNTPQCRPIQCPGDPRCPVDSCRGVTCPVGQSCNPQTGSCEGGEEPCKVECDASNYNYDADVCALCKEENGIKTGSGSSQQQSSNSPLSSSSNRQSSAKVSTSASTQATSRGTVNPITQPVLNVADWLSNLVGARTTQEVASKPQEKTERGFTRKVTQPAKQTQQEQKETQSIDAAQPPQPAKRQSALENFFRTLARLFGG